MARTPAICSSMTTSLSMEAPMMGGIRGDIVPTMASRMLLPIFFRVRGSFFFAAGDLAAFTEVAQFQDFLVGFAHVVADDDLELAALQDNAEDAVDRLDSRLVRFALVFEDEPQARHAVGNACDVIHAAELVHDRFGNDCIIFCHL